MNRCPLLLFSLISFFFYATLPAQAALQTEEVAYKADGVVMKGYLAYDDKVQGKRPGVLVVHEWWGHNEYARKRARMLAKLGYTALAVDMYGDGKQADHPENAGKFAAEVRKNMPVAEKRFRAAFDHLRRHSTVDRERVAAMGYCFGGGIVLEMARRGVELDGVVSFHGSLGTTEPARAERVKARVLVFNGAADQFVKPEEIERFKTEMNNAGVDYEFVSYPGALHSFTNPSADALGKKFNLPLAYDAKADKKSWKKTQNFLESIF